MNKIQLYRYRLEIQHPLQVLGYNAKYRKGFLLIQEIPEGFRIGEAAPLPSFHKISFDKIEQELRYFIEHNHLPIGNHTLSQFAIDMLKDKSNQTPTKCVRTINALYHPDISKEDIKKFQHLKIKVGRKNIISDLDTIKKILDIHPNIRLRLDANGLWTFKDCLYFWEGLLQNSLVNSIEYIEDPLQDIEKNIHHLSHIPIALDEAVASRKVKSGDLVLLVSFGAGLTWGITLIQWH